MLRDDSRDVRSDDLGSDGLESEDWESDSSGAHDLTITPSMLRKSNTDPKLRCRYDYCGTKHPHL